MKAERKQFVQFLIGGGVAALVNVVSRYAFNRIFSYQLSIVFAFIAGMLTAFCIFKFVVFKANHSHRILKESFWFIAINLFALVQTFVVSVGLAEYIFPAIHFTLYPHDIAHVIGVSVPVFASYVGHKKLTFPQKV